MRRPQTTAIALVIVLGTFLLGNSLGPPVQTTGAPAVGTFTAERTCSQPGCHAGSPLNSGGMLEILGLPATYVPGHTYPITIRLTSSQNATTPRWGFEFTLARLSDGKGSGSVDAPTLNLNIINTRWYVSQSFSNLQAGEHGSVEWHVSWTAPDPAEGPVGFYAAGNASNGNFAAGLGDLIYTAAETTGADVVPVRSVTWGGLKRTYVP